MRAGGRVGEAPGLRLLCNIGNFNVAWWASRPAVFRVGWGNFLPPTQERVPYPAPRARLFTGRGSLGRFARSARYSAGTLGGPGLLLARTTISSGVGGEVRSPGPSRGLVVDP